MRQSVCVFLLLCGMAVAWPAQAATSVELSIERHASLTEQVLFESDLQQLPQVRKVIPLRLNPHHREYRLLLTDSSPAGWLGRWLEQHGYQARQTEHGWQAY